MPGIITSRRTSVGPLVLAGSHRGGAVADGDDLVTGLARA